MPGGKAREGNWNSSWARWRERKVYREDWEEAWDKVPWSERAVMERAGLAWEGVQVSLRPSFQMRRWRPPPQNMTPQPCGRKRAQEA